MVKHIILWTIDQKFSAEQKAEIFKNAKKELEALKGKVPGLLEIKIQPMEKYSVLLRKVSPVNLKNLMQRVNSNMVR